MQLTHAALNQIIDVSTANYWTCYYSESQKATLVISIGTAVIPVKESPEQVREAYVKGLHGLAALQGAKTAGKNVENTAKNKLQEVPRDNS